MAQNNQIPNGAIIKFKGDPKVYLVDNGKLRHFTKEVQMANGQSIFTRMVELDPSYKTGFEEGASISSNLPFDAIEPSWKNNIQEISDKQTTPPNQTQTPDKTQTTDKIQTPNQTVQFISEDKVRETFEAFGYEPDQKDIAYWTRKPLESLDDMVEKLNDRVKNDTDVKNAPDSINWAGKVLDKGTTEINPLDDAWLLKFESDPDGSGPMTSSTIFLVGKDDKTIRPFLNEQSFNNYMVSIGKPEVNIGNAAETGLITLVPTELFSSGLALSKDKGYEFLTNEYGVQTDGTFTTQET